LGAAQLNAYQWITDTGYIRYLINGQGRGVFGTGIHGDTSPTLFMLIYDSTGKGNYVYNQFNDLFQPGTPHEMGMFFLDSTYILGGGNEAVKSNQVNGTVRSWKVSDGRIVVLLGETAYGYAVFQYFSYPGESVVRMQMSYTNTGSVARTVQAQRGGDPDFDEFPTNNGRGLNPTAPANVVYGIGQVDSKSICVYSPGAGNNCNTSVISSWPLYSPNTVLTGENAGNGDHAIYQAWDFGTVAPGSTVTLNCYYVIGIGTSAFQSYIC
jgi:hypothetical protein